MSIRTILVLAVLVIAACEPPAEIALTRTEHGVLVMEGADSVLHYRAVPADPSREHARGHYVHPLWSLDGVVLTEDFPEDHPHQHGLFSAWHQVFVGETRVGDGWEQIDIEWSAGDVTVMGDSALRATTVWTSPNVDGPILEESTTYVVHPRTETYRLIDVTVGLRALMDSVRIGGSEDEKGYGGYSARIRLPEDVAFRGRDGEVEPLVTAVEAGPWIDLSASFGDVSGLALLQHPSNPDYPQPWILRRADSMQNPRWPGREAVALSQDRPVELRYRLVVHQGGADAVSLDELHAAYAAE